jgi:WD40 repeat protein
MAGDEESGELHRELEGFGGYPVTALATFLSADGQQPRLLAGSYHGHVRVYDLEAGSVLHRLEGHTERIAALACIVSSSAAPHHPLLVSTSWLDTIKVWDGEIGEVLEDLLVPRGPVRLVAVWKEHMGGHDRIAVAGYDGHARVWDGEASTLLHDLDCGGGIAQLLPFETVEGPARLLVAPQEARRGLQVWDPEERRLLHDGINHGCPLNQCHVFESAQGRHLVAVVGRGKQHPRHRGGMERSFLDVWDLGEAPAWTGHVRPANKQG